MPSLILEHTAEPEKLLKAFTRHLRSKQILYCKDSVSTSGSHLRTGTIFSLRSKKV